MEISAAGELWYLLELSSTAAGKLLCSFISIALYSMFLFFFKLNCYFLSKPKLKSEQYRIVHQCGTHCAFYSWLSFEANGLGSHAFHCYLVWSLGWGLTAKTAPSYDDWWQGNQKKTPQWVTCCVCLGMMKGTDRQQDKQRRVENEIREGAKERIKVSILWAEEEIEK